MSQIAHETIEENVIKANKELNEIKELSTSPLSITGDLIRFGSTVYPVGNIASSSVIEKMVIRPNEPKFKGKWLLVLSVILLIVGFNTNAFLSIIGAISIIISLFMRTKPSPDIFKYYGVQIQTNSGASDLFFSEDKEFIEKVAELIVNVLIKSGKSYSYTVNIADKIIQDTSVKVQNTEINHVSNFDIKVQHSGLSKEDMDYLVGDFKKSIEGLDIKLQEVKDQTARDELSKLVEEINSEKPDPSKMKKSWEKVSKLCDSYETVSTISDVGSQVMKAIMMFV